jgi:hypothetical protein
LLSDGLEVILVNLVMGHQSEDYEKAVVWDTIAEIRSRALIRMLMSWSSMLDRMTLWYSPTKCGWLGTILTNAIRAMYLTANYY